MIANGNIFRIRASLLQQSVSPLTSGTEGVIMLLYDFAECFGYDVESFHTKQKAKSLRFTHHDEDPKVVD